MTSHAPGISRAGQQTSPVAEEGEATATGDWQDHASCQNHDPELWFPVGYKTAACWRQINAAARVCLGCPVRQQCLDYAIAHPGLDGVWAGSTPAQRDVIRRRRGYRPKPHKPSLVQGRQPAYETEERRVAARVMRDEGMSQREIAAALGVTQQSVWYLLTSTPREVEAAG